MSGRYWKAFEYFLKNKVRYSPLKMKTSCHPASWRAEMMEALWYNLGRFELGHRMAWDHSSWRNVGASLLWRWSCPGLSNYLSQRSQHCLGSQCRTHRSLSKTCGLLGNTSLVTQDNKCNKDRSKIQRKKVNPSSILNPFTIT